MTRKRILFVAAEMAARAFLPEPIKGVAEDHDVALASPSPDPELLRSLGSDGPSYTIPIARPMRPLQDLKALAALIRLMRRERFDAVHSVTPKAGLLAMVAGRIAGIPIRTHSFTGQVWVTRTGFKRGLLKGVDRLLHQLTSFSLVDSPSQRDFLIAEGVIAPARSAVLADGSISGVDLGRFRPDPAARARIRAELGLAEADLVFLYLGRLTGDKGLQDLVPAFAAVRRDHRHARLLLVGPDEEQLGAELLRLAGDQAAGLSLVGPTNAPEAYMAAADLFCLPSYREGFGSVLIEAAAAGLPAIASRIYGIVDAVADGETGFLHPPGDAAEIERLMRLLVEDEALRSRLGRAALERARTRFSSARLRDAFRDYYAKAFAGSRSS